ncbi:hypothetical protein [Streptomyces sp. SP18CM02]|uniref:hypothetical protein n=1 Tax=Streptomyces sp. SP18CM02 TaxID=2758571 RepID=UPI00168BD363|nr:hypothetical protein [Streptomyces sp. SP18CM02]MBD3550880.1 hypothetical protein [Streptomyces sp. SP18CM02]
MRRPAQHHSTPAIHSAWAHPYTGIPALGVFYNDGGNRPAPTHVPTPAEVAARTAPPTTPQVPQTPVDPEDEKVTFTQRRLNTIMRDEKEEGRRAALRAIAESAGLNPDQVDLDQVGKLVKEAGEANRQRMSEVERQQADAQAATERAAQQVADAEKKAAAAQALAFEAQQQMALIRLGANPDDLADVTALLRNDLHGIDQPTVEQIREKAEALKARRPADFGGTVPQALPPAPGGAPAGGPPARTPAGGKDAVTQKARERAERMGLRNPEAA